STSAAGVAHSRWIGWRQDRTGMDQLTSRRNHGEAVAHAAIAARPRLSNVLVLLEEREQGGDEPTAPFVRGHGMLRDHLAVLGKDDLERQAITASLDNF